MTKWHYWIDGQEHGPVSSAELKNLARDGILQPAHLLRREDLADPVPAGNVRGLFPSPPPSGDTKQAATTPSPPVRQPAAEQQPQPLVKAPADSAAGTTSGAAVLGRRRQRDAAGQGHGDGRPQADVERR